jgi:hypothetical protein
MAYIKKYDGNHYYGKKSAKGRLRNKDGSVYAGKGKVRPHHKAALKQQMASKGLKTKHADAHDKKMARVNEVHHTPNKYQTEAKKVGESPDGCTEVYQWVEDNGHKDHVQLRTAHRIKDEDRRPWMMAEPSKEYKENYSQIKGFKKKRGAQTGKYKKFKKVYK